MIQCEIADRNSDKKINTLEVIIFFVVTYGISLLFGIPLYFKKYESTNNGNIYDYITSIRSCNNKDL